MNSFESIAKPRCPVRSGGTTPISFPFRLISFGIVSCGKLAVALSMAVMLLVCGCVSWIGGVKELTPAERSILVAYARDVICKTIPDSRLSQADKRVVMADEPVFGAHYTGWKRGSYTVKWPVDLRPDGSFTRSVVFKGDGDMLSPQSSFRGLVLNGDAPPGSKF